MSRLSKLYDAMQTLRNEGLALEDIENQVSQLEEEIIQKEILPIVTESIAPALKEVQRELVLVVDYKPNEPISVHLSRRRNIMDAIDDAKVITPDPSVEHKVNNTPRKKKQDIAPRTAISVLKPSSPPGVGKDTQDVKLAKINAAEIPKIIDECKRLILLPLRH